MRLRDFRVQVRIAARLRQVESGNLGDWKPVQGDLRELAVNYGPGYRLCFVRRGRVLVVLLIGGCPAGSGTFGVRWLWPRK